MIAGEINVKAKWLLGEMLSVNVKSKWLFGEMLLVNVKGKWLWLFGKHF